MTKKGTDKTSEKLPLVYPWKCRKNIRSVLVLIANQNISASILFAASDTLPTQYICQSSMIVKVLDIP